MAREQFETHLKATGAGHRILNVATSIGGRSAANEVMREAQQMQCLVNLQWPSRLN